MLPLSREAEGRRPQEERPNSAPSQMDLGPANLTERLGETMPVVFYEGPLQLFSHADRSFRAGAPKEPVPGFSHQVCSTKLQGQ